MPFLHTFVDWIAKQGEAKIASGLGVSQQSVRSWRRWAAGAPRSNNVYPPSLQRARDIEALSGYTITLVDIYGPSEKTKVPVVR